VCDVFLLLEENFSDILHGKKLNLRGKTAGYPIVPDKDLNTLAHNANEALDKFRDT